MKSNTPALDLESIAYIQNSQRSSKPNQNLISTLGFPLWFFSFPTPLHVRCARDLLHLFQLAISSSSPLSPLTLYKHTHTNTHTHTLTHTSIMSITEATENNCNRQTFVRIQELLVQVFLSPPPPTTSTRPHCYIIYIRMKETSDGQWNTMDARPERVYLIYTAALSFSQISFRRHLYVCFLTRIYTDLYTHTSRTDDNLLRHLGALVARADTTRV